jgi:hypothetical protein
MPGRWLSLAKINRSIPTFKSPEKTAEPTGGIPSVAPVNTFKGVVFTDEKDIPMVYTGTFDGCEFKMDAIEKRNFAGARFLNCKFANGFKFIRCNLYGASGIENVEKEGCFVARSSPTPPAPKGMEKNKRQR